MGIPDRIERTVCTERPLERVWTAITTAEGLGTWFAHSAEIDLRVVSMPDPASESVAEAAFTALPITRRGTVSCHLVGVPVDARTRARTSTGDWCGRSACANT
jgi:hypothetical protein